jgi:hypothetical protein
MRSLLLLVLAASVGASACQSPTAPLCRTVVDTLVAQPFNALVPRVERTVKYCGNDLPVITMKPIPHA